MYIPAPPTTHMAGLSKCSNVGVVRSSSAPQSATTLRFVELLRQTPCARTQVEYEMCPGWADAGTHATFHTRQYPMYITVVAVTPPAVPHPMSMSGTAGGPHSLTPAAAPAPRTCRCCETRAAQPARPHTQLQITHFQRWAVAGPSPTPPGARCGCWRGWSWASPRCRPVLMTRDTKPCVKLSVSRWTDQ